MMNQTHVASQQALLQPAFVGELDAPRITMLGSLDDDQGTSGLALEAQAPKPFLAIIYAGI